MLTRSAKLVLMYSTLKMEKCDTNLYFILSDISDICILKHNILTRVSTGNNTITKTKGIEKQTCF